LLQRLLIALAEMVDRRLGWHSLPLPVGVLALIAYRARLRRDNLFDTGGERTTPLQGASPRYLVARAPDGSYNDLNQPATGSTGTRFGRNVPLARTFPEPPERLLHPNPRLVSRELLARDTFKPATTLNLLAAAWLQFQVHDWLSHGRNDKNDPFQVPIEPEDDWPERPMRILRTAADPSSPAPTEPPTYVNTATGWWDGSQIYGSGADMLARLRSGVDGKLSVGADGLLPLDERGLDLTGVNGNWWVGLSIFHTLFTLEHNAICHRLRAEFPSWSDDDLFDHARLINAALMAKIHTVEWTPAILAHPTTRYALRANWRGILGSPTDHHRVPYAITEEFVAVYRMHPLLPDEITFRSAATGAVLPGGPLPFMDIAFERARPVMQRFGWADTLYSFGTQWPGAITLHNFPAALQRFRDMEGNLLDLAAIDLIRIRERGVPRYNDFRALLHKPRVRRFEDLSTNPEWVEQLRHVYGNDIDSVDLMVGLYAEPLPPGFGFSDTAFRIFILMASRRLKSDRFFTRDYTAGVYTQTGMAWIASNNLSSVLLRHCPALAPWLRHAPNPFAPWPTAA
jgi:hypothetical protein